MNFTFGIITNGSDLITGVIDSIRALNIKNYEIIIVGNYYKYKDLANDIKYIRYADTSEEGDISAKKNIITRNALYENIVYLHDYVSLDSGWYDGFLKFGNDFNVCITKMINRDGSRFRDWCLWYDDARKYVAHNHYLIPYNIKHLSKMMYISGAYFIAKKDFMIKHPLWEKLKWGQGEDVEWSIRVRPFTEFKINTNSKAILLKDKDRIFQETTEDENNILRSIVEYDDSESYLILLKKHLDRYL